jgi:hypothetical protein
MSTTVYLRHAQRLLEAALMQAQQERDRAVFEVARGERSLQQLLRLVERAALVQAGQCPAEPSGGGSGPPAVPAR